MTRSEEFSTGYGSARVTSSGYLYNLVVGVEHRGQGHGHELLRMVTSHADRQGRALYTQARRELHPFYGRHGFAPTSEAVGIGGAPVLKRSPR